MKSDREFAVMKSAWECSRLRSAWTDQRADETVARYADEGVNQDLALRLYTTRLLGRDPLLVLHGGGNTSVKTTVTDLLGEDTEVLCVKGSGWDLAEIEPPGLPPVRMEPLLRLRSLEVLSDENMVRFQRRRTGGPVVAEPLRRDAVARVPAAQVRGPHPLRSGPGAHRSTR